MSKGRSKKKKKKKELCTFLILWWMNLMPLIHTLPSCFFSTSVFLMFSVSTLPNFSIRYIHPFDLLELAHVWSTWSSQTLFVETKGSFTLNVLLHSTALLFHNFFNKNDWYVWLLWTCPVLMTLFTTALLFLYTSILHCTAATFIALTIIVEAP